MSKLTIDMYNDAPGPKRGDLLQSNVGDKKRERTWFILRATPLKPIKGVPRFKIIIERWYDIDPDIRVKLYLNAERHGGQNVIHFKRYKPKKRRKSFEQYMGGM